MSHVVLNEVNLPEILFKAFWHNSACSIIYRWLCEMDGEDTEEDHRIYVNSVKLDGSIIHPSFKKVSKSSIRPFSYYW